MPTAGVWLILKMAPQTSPIESMLKTSHTLARTMRSHTPREKAKITAGAVTALVIVAWLAVVAFALLAA